MTDEELAQMAARIEMGELIPPEEYPLVILALRQLRQARHEINVLKNRVTVEAQRLNRAATERDEALARFAEAREIACKLLYIAESRGPKVFGPRPVWLKTSDER